MRSRDEVRSIANDADWSGRNSKPAWLRMDAWTARRLVVRVSLTVAIGTRKVCRSRLLRLYPTEK